MVPGRIYNKDLYSWKGPRVPCYGVQSLLSPAISTFHGMAAACIRPKWSAKSVKQMCIHQSKAYKDPNNHYFVFYVFFNGLPKI